MMRLFNEQSVEDIADEVREQRGVTDTYTIAELRTAVHNAIQKYKQNNPTNTVNDGVLTNSYDVPLLGLKIKGNTQKASGYIPILPGNTSDYPMYINNLFSLPVTDEDRLGYFSSSGKLATSGSNGTRVIPCTGGQTFYWKHCSNEGGGRTFTASADEVAIGIDASVARGETQSVANKVNSMTTASDAKWFFGMFYRQISGGKTIEEQASDYMLCPHPISANTPYVPYGLWFAVRNGNNYGYYNPATQEFITVSGMAGDDIERCEYVSGNNNAYCSTNYYLTGADTLRIKFRVSSASNIGGSFVSSSANNNYCLYAGTTSSGWYMRYNGGNNREFSGTREWVEMEATPTGWSANGSSGIWEQKEFTSTSPMYIGYLYNSSSPKLIGDMAYFEVAGKHKYLPVKVGNAYKMFDVLAWEFPTQNGTWDGGAVIIEDIPFPIGSTPSARLQSLGDLVGTTYVIPIEVTDGTNTNDINIYVDEQLRKVGDVADYIEFGKHYKLTKSVTLDAGTRTLSDAKANSEYVCDKQSDGTLDGQVITITSNNTTVVYELATPVEVVINFDKFNAYDGETTINVNTEIEPSSIEAEYIEKVGV